MLEIIEDFNGNGIIKAGGHTVIGFFKHTVQGKPPNYASAILHDMVKCYNSNRLLSFHYEELKSKSRKDSQISYRIKLYLKINGVLLCVGKKSRSYVGYNDTVMEALEDTGLVDPKAFEKGSMPLSYRHHLQDLEALGFCKISKINPHQAIKSVV